MAKLVVIIEDDSELSSAIKKAILNHSQDVTVEIFETAEDFKNHEAFQSHLDALIVDVLLPGQSGFDFLVEKKNFWPEATKVLISGVFTDPSFMESAKKQAQVSYFLTKPFELDALLKLLPFAEKEKQPDSTQSSEVSVLWDKPEFYEIQKSLYGFLAQNVRKPRLIQKLIENLESVHGYDLPFVFKLIMDSEISGYLNLVWSSKSQQNICGLTISHGEIVHVDSGDAKFQLGEILIDLEFLDAQDLERALQVKKDVRLGEYLVQEYFISPHALEVAMEHQLLLRLGELIQDRFYQINFGKSEKMASDFAIRRSLLYRYIHDFVLTKLPIEFTAARLFFWYLSPISFTDLGIYELEKLKDLYLIRTFYEDFKQINQFPLLKDLLGQRNFSDEFAKSLFFLMMMGIIQPQMPDWAQPENLKFLTQWLKACESDWYQAVGDLGFSWESFSKRKILLESFLKSIEDLPDPILQQKIKSIREQARSYGQEDQKAASSFRSRAQPEPKKSDGASKEVTLAEVLGRLDQAQKLLQSGRYKEAKALLEPFKGSYGHLPRFILTYLWSELGAVGPGQGQAEPLKVWESWLQKIPPDQRYDAQFQFVQGLWFKASGKLKEAAKAFQKALSFDRSFMPAHKELMALKTSSESQGLEQAKKLLGALFSRKKNAS